MNQSRRLSAALLVLLLLLSTRPAFARSSAITHPEMGEYISIRIRNHMPSFSVYDFPYYQVQDPNTAYRGMKANFTVVPNNYMMSLDRALNAFYKSLADGKIPHTLVYKGQWEAHGQALAALSQEDWVRAVRILAGFEGQEGYAALAELPGFGGVDLAALTAGHVDFSAQVGKDSYPYRLLSFYFEGEDWTVYTERYGFLQVKGVWKLSRIAREYNESHLGGVGYVHGQSGSEKEDIKASVQELLQGLSFASTREDALLLPGASLDPKEQLLLPDLFLFGLPTSASLSFDELGLKSIRYAFKGNEAYYAAFISLFTRFLDPITIDNQGRMGWSTEEGTITLNFSRTAPSLLITRR